MGRENNQTQHWLKYENKFWEFFFVNPFAVVAEEPLGLCSVSCGRRHIKLRS
jgi:hypothetical protein